MALVFQGEGGGGEDGGQTGEMADRAMRQWFIPRREVSYTSSRLTRFLLESEEDERERERVRGRRGGERRRKSVGETKVHTS